ncbi:MAG TPA: hypothetical protein VF941_08810 [Clostridia bacterium]
MLRKGKVAIQGVVKETTLNKIDYLAELDIVSRSRIVSKIIEENIDNYMPEGYEQTEVFKRIIEKSEKD